MNSLSDILSEKADEMFPPDDANKRELTRLIHATKDHLDAMLRILHGEAAPRAMLPEEQVLPGGERIVEGAFTGEKMRSDDGKEYAVPPNYASKSKLAPGDRMKLTITKSGSFIYKQTGPVERTRVIGELAPDPSGNGWIVIAEDKPYKVLTASVTFYKGKSGDEAILLIPRDSESQWGAVENIMSK